MTVVTPPAPTAQPASPALTIPTAPAAQIPCKRLPAGQPREWYESHNRKLKAMRLASALLNSGVYHPTQASDRRIRAIAPLVGVHPPSTATCRLVRRLMLH
ncbi:hypothetical protein JGS22_004125 [Streptomyces sp. P38-E01]|uniref:Uncharacterized protein n=1 Tax=Streptomyces tardus TaxID=2780544 RepID=A0A949JIE7_9ACTN|nr:hypothetical protein [Streptomyces tardus]MBU7596844.1 hypothetical protein [Streptomyces tardus]